MTYVQIPDSTIDDANLTLLDLAVLLHCLRADSEEQLTERYIAEKSHYMDEVIGSSLENLEHLGYLTRINWRDDQGEHKVGTIITPTPIQDIDAERIGKDAVKKGTYLGLVQPRAKGQEA